LHGTDAGSWLPFRSSSMGRMNSETHEYQGRNEPEKRHFREFNLIASQKARNRIHHG
jgi:hypothetical protein